MEHNPYVGPRPYTRADRVNFYGRNREARDLLDMLIAERVVLFYAQSGAGKSSLLNAKVIPDLEGRGFRVLPPLRVGSDAPPQVDAAAISNIFIFSTLLSLAGPDTSPETLAGRTLLSFLQTLDLTSSRHSERSEESHLAEAEPPVLPILIWDQFEELFTTHRDRWDEATDFFTQVSAALEGIPELGVVFVMREDHIAAIEPYAPLLPHRLRARFRMERLGYEGALEAVKKPAMRAGCPFAEGVAERLVDNLRRIKTQEAGGKTQEVALGPYVEPVQLQVVCSRLWENLPEQRDRLIQWEEVAQFGDVDQALTDFYEDALRQTVQAEPRVTERSLRRWFGEQLITPLQTRGLALRGETETGGLPNGAVDKLESLHIIRAEARAGARWYELSHDRLVEPVLRSNRAWEEARQTPLRLVARQWQETGDDSLLYHGAALKDALRVLEQAEVEPYEREFVVASQQAEQSRIRRRRLTLAGAMAGVIVVILMTALTILAVNGQRAAEAERVRAEEQARIALSRQLAAQAQSELSNLNPDLALLLAIESLCTENTLEAQAQLRRVLAQPQATQWILTGHTAGVGAARWNFAGDRIATGADDGSVMIWDGETGEWLRDLPGHLDGIYALEWDASGERLLTAGLDNSARVWDAATGAQLLGLEHPGMVFDAAWSADWGYIATACDDGAARIWDAHTGALVLTLPHPEFVWRVAWRDYLLLTAAGDGAARIWDLSKLATPEASTSRAPGGGEGAAKVTVEAYSGQAPLVMAGHDGWVTSVAWSPDGRWIATSGVDGLALVWDARTGRLQSTLAGHTSAIWRATWSADGRHILTVSDDRTARVWDAQTGEPTAILAGHTDQLTWGAWSPDDALILTTSKDKTVRIWDAQTGDLRALLAGHRGEVRTAQWSRDGARLLSSSDDQTARLWSLALADQPRGELPVLSGHTGPIEDMVMNKDKSRLLTAGDDGAARVWDTATGALRVSLLGHEGVIWRARWSPDENRIATASDDGTARIWDAQSGDLLLTLRGHAGASVDGVAWNADGTRLLTISNDGAARVWDAATGEELVVFAGHTNSVRSGAWSPAMPGARPRILTAGEDREARVWDAATGEELLILDGHTDTVWDALWSADARTIVTISGDGTARIWDATTGETLHILEGHTGGVYGVKWSPDGRRLLTVSDDRTARVWDATTGAPVIVLQGHGAWGDMDGDGDLDLAVGELTKINVYPNVNGMVRSQPVWSVTPAANVTSVAWGDMDGDGWLDLAVGETYRVVVYRNVGGTLQATPVWSATHADYQRTTVAWGDVDGNGTLDLAVGYSKEAARLYRNDGGMLQATPVWTATEPSKTQDVAWGDVNGDGALDLAVANWGGPVRVYLNTGATLQPAAGWTAPVTTTARSIAWGDSDSDGDLDLAVGNEDAPNQVYLNDHGDLSAAVDWTSADRDNTWDVAWGDVDGDGDLELAAANYYNLSKLYLNRTPALATENVWQASNPPSQSIHSLAWGDVDNDNDLDLAIGAYGANRLYLNVNGALESTSVWTATDYADTRSVAWGDMDGDGDLDLATGAANTARVYLNEGGVLQANAAWTPLESEPVYAVAWGDVDGDGDLDLAAATDWDSTNKIYYNVGGNLQRTPGWESTETWTSTGLAWGDVDGDGDLDLAFSNAAAPNQLYLNIGGRLIYAVWLSDEINETTGLAWGDVDGDGDLDLAVSNEYAPNCVYFNVGGMLQTTAGWSSADTDDTYSIAWGDVDNDGDLDLVAGNLDTPSKVYPNTGGKLSPRATWVSEAMTQTRAVALGDVNHDGRLDLALGGDNDARLYLSRRHAQARQAAPAAALSLALVGGPTATFSHTVTALAPANFYATPAIRQETVRISYTLAIPAGGSMGWVQGYYSTDGGGRWQTAVATSQTITRNLTAGEHTYIWDVLQSGLFGQSDAVVFRLQAYPFLPGRTNTITATYRYTNAIAGPYQQPYLAAQTFPFRVRGSQVRVLSDTVPVDNALVLRQTAGDLKAAPYSDFNGQPFRTDARGYLQGRGQLQVGDRLVALLPVGVGGAPTPPLAEGFEGDFPPEGWATYQTGAPDDPGWQLGAYGAHGGQNYALHDEVPTTGDAISWLVTPRIVIPVDGELRFWQRDVYPEGNYYVYHGVWLSAAAADPQAGDYIELWSGDADEGWTEQRINLSAYAGQSVNLAFRYEGDYADQWFIDDVTVDREGATSRYDLYYASAAPISTGLTTYAVTALGVQTLTVSSAHPLFLFNLDVSLEWDARADAVFLSQLKSDLRRASELLYDATNGQAALGNLTIYHDKQHWNTAAIQIHASNALIPNADVGGIVATKTTRTVTINPYALPGTLPYTLTYLPGAVRMGTVWGRYGAAGGVPGEDWPRALAHELGHYLFYLYDNYMGLDAAGALIPVNTCGGSLMSNPYENNEYRNNTNWAADCAATLSVRRNGRADWETIAAFYSPLQTGVWAGPAMLPLEVTKISEVPSCAAAPLSVFIFSLTDAYGALLQPGPHAQAILYQNNRAVDLGHPEVNNVTAHGARAGDRLCVYELDASPPRWGCETLAIGDASLALVARDGWRPEILVTPWSSATAVVTVTNVPAGLSLRGRIYPHNGEAGAMQSLTAAGDGYTATFTLPTPDTQALVQIWVDEAETETSPRREAVTGYAIGGSAACPPSCSSCRHPPCSRQPAADAACAAGGQNFRPAIAPDGQVLLYADFTATEGFYTLQKATRLPDPLPWATVVGAGYYILQTPDAPPLTDTASINFRYRRQDVPPGEENFLSLYYWTGGGWTKLPTARHPGYNEVTAPAQGSGLYALMSSLEIPLPFAGWNLASYPVQGTRAVTDALASIAGYYHLVYGYDPGDAADPWKMYSPSLAGIATWVNDLHTLQFGHGYWISVTRPITWSLKGTEAGLSSLRNLSNLNITPPATYYGRVLAGPAFTPTVGMTVLASIEGRVCARTRTRLVDGWIVYTLNVGYTPATGVCGEPGQTVTFTVDGQTMTAAPAWQNHGPQEVTLSAGAGVRHVYLPLTMKQF